VPAVSLDQATRLGGAERAASKHGRPFRGSLLGYALIAPAVVLIGLLILYPLGDAIYLSMTRNSFINPNARFVGLDNYRQILRSPVFREVVQNSIVWTVCVVVVQFVVGIATALLLNQRFVGRGAMRALVIVPWVMPGIIGGILWKLMYEPYLGLVNRFLIGGGIIHHYIPWLAQPDTVMAAIIVAAVWKGAPFSTLMYLAAYQNVSHDLIEAAQLDGANFWQRLRTVLIPEMAPTIRTTVLLTTVWTFNYFDLIYITTRGGPGIASHIFPTYIYELAFVKVQYGLAATYGVVSVVILLVFSSLYIRELNKAEVFEA
jgi:multiple sugar transport system permease protein